MILFRKGNIMKWYKVLCRGNKVEQIVCIQADFPEQACDLVMKMYGLKYNEYKII